MHLKMPPAKILLHVNACKLTISICRESVDSDQTAPLGPHCLLLRQCKGTSRHDTAENTKSRLAAKEQSSYQISSVFLFIPGDYTIMGATSYGHGCAEANAPGVYARVKEFLPWIKRVVKSYT